MAHRTSSAALHAARVVLQHYELTVRPPEQIQWNPIRNLQATDVHVAIVIDLVTNAYVVALLRPELRYWQRRLTQGPVDADTPGQVCKFIYKTIEALDSVPKELPSTEKVTRTQAGTDTGWNPMIELSRASLDATRSLFYYYEVKPLEQSSISSEMEDRLNVAKILEVSLGLRKAVRALPLLHACWNDLRKDGATQAEVRACLRRVGILLGSLPCYQEQDEETKLLV